MAGASWSNQEKQDCLSLDFEEFHDRYPHRGWNSYRFKRARLIEQAQKRPSPEVHVSSPKPEPREADWEKLFSSLESAEVARGRLSPTDEVAHITTPDNLPYAIAFMGDLHIGASGVDYARLRSDLDTIASTDGIGLIVNGDLFENAKPQMKSGNALYHGLFNSPREQFYYAKTRLTPVQEKILAITQGNHDARDGMMAGIDRLPDLCRSLGTTYFSEKGGTIYLKVGGQEYVIIAKHQFTGNSKITPTNSARRMWLEWPHSWELAHVIALAHFHDPHVYQHEQRGKDVVWLRNGSYKIHDEWSESKGFRPAYGVPVIVFFPGEHKMVSFKDFDEGIRYLQTVRAAYREKEQAA